MSAQKSSGANPEALDNDLAPPRSTSFGRFLIDIVVVGLCLAGIVFYYNSCQQKKQLITKKRVKARDALKKHDLGSLKKAEALYKEILTIEPRHGASAAGLAEALFHQKAHGIDRMADSEKQLQISIDEEAETPTRYAMEAYLMINKGNAAAAETYIKNLLEQDIGSSKLAHALGWAHLEQGRFLEANRVIGQAKEADFSAVVFRITLAELAHRQGKERAAVRQLKDVFRDNMNPDHALARAWTAALQLKNYGDLVPPVSNIQQIRETKGDIGPTAEAYMIWAEGELELAMKFKAKAAMAKADEALTKIPDFPPFLDLKARASVARRKYKDAVGFYEQALSYKHEYRGIKWSLAKLKSKRKNDSALQLVEELERTFQGMKGPEFEIFRGEHYLRKGDLEQAKAAFTKAADLGDNPDILLGLAKITFQEEKEKDKKADLERVAHAFQEANSKRTLFPELHQYLAKISIWNFQLDAANGDFTRAEKQFKKLNRPRPELVKFYNRVIRSFRSVKERKLKKQGKKFAQEWKKKKEDYLNSVGG